MKKERGERETRKRRKGNKDKKRNKNSSFLFLLSIAPFFCYFTTQYPNKNYIHINWG